MTAIQAIQVSKSYGHYQVLKEVNLEVHPGDCFALFGPNGSGKTTLLRILGTLYRPTAGRVEILGRDGVKEREAVRASLMLLAHGAHLYDDLNATENLRFALALRDRFPSERDIKKTMDHMGIGAFTDMKIRYYSAGMKKRLALAKAMLAQPKVLLLDEPFTALDTTGTEILKRYIKEATAEGGAVLMSTHDQEKARDVAQRAGILSHGVLRPLSLQETNPDELS